MDVTGCEACDLHSGRRDLPGGIIHQTASWNVSHCVGPLGVGTLIVTPRRHVVHVWDLDEDERTELGPLLGRTAQVLRGLCDPDQVYVCLWSHAGGQPGHVHFVVQPAAKPQPGKSHGPKRQTEMFAAGVLPDSAAVGDFADRARASFASV